MSENNTPSHFYIQVEALYGSPESVVSETSQLQINNTYTIVNPLRAVASNIFNRIKHMIDSRYTESTIYRQLQTDGKYGFVNYNNDAVVVVICSNNTSGVYYYDDLSEKKAGIVSRTIYHVTELPDDKRCYIVVDKIKGNADHASIEKCYHPYFTDEDEALTYYGNLLSEYAEDKIDDSELSIFVKNIDELVSSEWYCRNVSAYDMIDRYHLPMSEFRYISDFDKLDELIRFEAYDDLPAEDRIQINRFVVENILYSYMDVDQVYQYTQSFDDEYIDPDMAEVYTNQAIGLVLANASSQAEFDKIYADLGIYAKWIYNLNDDVYRQHPNRGYVLVERDGEIKWYSDDDAFCVGRWSGADEPDNPYYGKFQPNACDTLLCFKEYHPELIVDRFPTSAFVNQCKRRRIDIMCKERRLHSELRCDIDDNGIEYYSGTWYPSGVANEPYASGEHGSDLDDADPIAFDAVYGTHRFTEDEARNLLSGDEIEIQHYKSLKTNIECTIHGQLKEESDLYTGDCEIKFVRTDIDMAARQRKIASIEAMNS